MSSDKHSYDDIDTHYSLTSMTQKKYAYYRHPCKVQCNIA